jgi:hypothetical protein
MSDGIKAPKAAHTSENVIKPTTTSTERRKSCLSSFQHDTDASSSCRLRKSVSFHQVEIREYNRIVGDNPAVTAGPAVSMAWKHHSKASFSLDQFEESRPPRRSAGEFQMPANIRTSLLTKNGASQRDLQRSQSEILRIKRHRQASAAMQELEGTQILVQSVKRKWKRLVTGVSQQQEQEALWKNAAKQTNGGTALTEETEDTLLQDDDDDHETEC